MLPGLLLLLALQCLGELIKIATGTVLPGPVIGLLLLLLMLVVRGAPVSLERAGDALVAQLGVLFVPPAVGLFFLGPALAGQWAAILASAVVATVLTLVFGAVLMQWLVTRHERRRAAADKRRGSARRASP